MTRENDVSLADYLPLLVAGDASSLRILFDDTPRVSDPREGEVTGDAALEDFVEASAAWLQARSAAAEVVATTASDARVIVEYELHLTEDGERIALPVAVVGDRAQGGFWWVRVYHSMWPLLGSHRLRPPLLAADATLELPDVVARYQDALARGDVGTVLQQFEPDGYAREPSGGRYHYQGHEALRAFYQGLFANGGGISLEHCTATDDGTRCAIEYNVTQWGQTELPPQAGVAVYERGESGLLCAARIYDDVDPPEPPTGPSS